MLDTCPFCQKLQHLQKLPPGDLVWEFPHSVVLLGPWQYYTGYCIVASRRHASELSELSPTERHGFFDEMCLVAQAIEATFQPRKLNYELLGNQVAHLHWHLFPRRADDPDMLRPVWFALDQAERDENVKKRMMTGPWTRDEISAKLRLRLEQIIQASRAP